MADIVDDIKSRLSIEEVVSQYVQLKKAGRNLKGLCPFHSEKTPSFIVSPEKQICHCFGCNKGGDIFVVVQELEGVSFVEAMKILADSAGIKLDKDKLAKKAGKCEKDEYYGAHGLAADFFEKQLHETDDGKKVLDYLHRRGLRDETIKEFRLGFAPDSYDALYPLLLKKSISREVLLKSGLINSKTISSDNIYDKYRARLMFPIFDSLGRLCAFGGRALKQEQLPKYLNSAENPIYNKSKILYGLYHTRTHIRDSKQIVLVEGYFDFLLPYQTGVRNVVATCGTALSSENIKTIKRIADRVICCFDTDAAGFEATKRAYFLFQEENVSIRIVKGIEQKDPADYVCEHGDQLKVLINQAPDFITFFANKLLKENDSGSLEGRKLIIRELLPFLKSMSAVERDFFVRDLSKKMDIQEKYLYEEIENYKMIGDRTFRSVQELPVKTVKFDLQELVLAFLLEYPKLFEFVVDLVNEFDFDTYVKEIYNQLTSQYNSLRENFREWNLENIFSPSDNTNLMVARLYVEDKYSEFSEELIRLELKKLIDKMKKDCKLRELKELQKLIEEAEKAQEKERLRELLKKQQELLNC